MRNRSMSSVIAVLSVSVGLGYLLGHAHLVRACQGNNCVQQCHRHTLICRDGIGDEIPGDGELLPGQYWAAIPCVTPTNPGGQLQLGGVQITINIYDDCCRACLGNFAANVSQEASEMTGEQVDQVMGAKNACVHGH